MSGPRKISDFLIGANEEVVAAYNNDLEGNYSFTKIWKLPKLSSQLEETFATIISPVCLLWKVNVNAPGRKRHDYQIRCLLHEDSKFQLNVPGYSKSQCSVKIRLLSNEREELISVVEQCAFVREKPSYPGFETSLSKLSQEILQRYIEERERGLACEIAVTLNLDPVVFRFVSSFGSSPSMPATGTPCSSRFADFFDRSQHDFAFVCTDGVVTANIEILMNSSMDFRKFFDDEGQTSNRLEIDAPTLAVNLVLIYIVTGHFRMNNSDLTPTFARAFFDLIERFVDTNTFYIISFAFESSCAMKLFEVGKNLAALVQWLPCAMSTIKYKWFTFAGTCVALLVEYHWNDYLREYIENQRIHHNKAELRQALLELRGEKSAHEELVALKRIQICAVIPIEDD